MTPEENIVTLIAEHFPETQGIYLFGSFGTAEMRADSDVDLAVLLSHSARQSTADLMLSPCRFALEEALGRRVDLLAARDVPTVFQKEIVAKGRLIACQDQNAVWEFEALTLSMYQRLNEERREILEQFAATRRAYDV